MHRFKVPAVSAAAVLCTGCSTLFLPTYDDMRKVSGHESLEEVRNAFNQIVEDSATEKDVRALKFGAPYTDEEIVGHLRMTAALTESQGIGDGAFLDEEIRACIRLEKAREKCQLLVIRDARHKRKGQGNALLYWTKIKREDEVSSWGYTIWLVFQDGVVIHKEFEPSLSPTRVERRTRDFGWAVDTQIRVP